MTYNSKLCYLYLHGWESIRSNKNNDVWKGAIACRRIIPNSPSWGGWMKLEDAYKSQRKEDGYDS